MTDPQPQLGTSGSAQNTDREIWRKSPDDYYSPAIHVTEGDGIGMNVGGTVVVLPIERWHALAMKEIKQPPADKTPAYVEGEPVQHNQPEELCTACNGTRDNPKVMLHGSSDDICWSAFHRRVSVGAQPGCPTCGGIPCANLDVCKALAPDLEQQLTDAAFPIGSNSANSQLVVDLGEAIDIVARSRTGSSPADAIRQALRVHWLSYIECNHYEGNDSAICACGWKSDRGFNVGKAVEFWIDHVFERAAPPSSPGAPHSEGDDKPAACPDCKSVRLTMIYKGWGDETYLRNYFNCRHPWHSENKPAFVETRVPGAPLQYPTMDQMIESAEKRNSSPGADTETK